MIQFLLNDRPVKPPANYKGLQLTYDWHNDRPQGSLEGITFEWVRENAQALNEHIRQGLAGGRGLMEGPALEIRLMCPGEAPLSIFRGFIDLSHPDTTVSCSEVVAPSVSTDSLDTLREQAQAFSFAYLYEKGVIQKSDFARVDYLINRVPDTERAALLSITVFILAKELYEAIKDIADILADIAGIFNAGGAVGKVIALAAYWVLLAVALVNLIREIVRALFPVPRTWQGMRLKTLFERGCEHLGLAFESSIFQTDPLLKHAVLLPAKYAPGLVAGLAPNDEGFPEKTFGQFLDEMVTLCNARIRVKDGVLRFERRDRAGEFSGYTLRRLTADQWKTNAGEWASNVLIRFAGDASEPNTTVNPQGRTCQVIYAPKTHLNRRHVTLKGLREVNLPYARGVRKKNQTTLEGIMIRISNAYHSVAGKIKDGLVEFRDKMRRRHRDRMNEVKDLPDMEPEKIKSLVNYLMVDSDFFEVDKLLITHPDGSGKLSPDNDHLTAEYFYRQYYRIDSPVPSGERPNGNQYKIYQDQQVRLCCHDFRRIIESNEIYVEALQKPARIEKLVYNPFTQTATLSFRVNELLTTNLAETIVAADTAALPAGVSAGGLISAGTKN